MSNKKLTILGLIAIVMILLAVLTSQMAEKKTTTVAAAKPLIQGLSPDLVSRIVIDPNGDKVELVKKGNSFVIANLANYPANIKNVNELFNKVLDVKVGSTPLTSNKENFDDLEISEAKASKVVKFFDSQDKLITGIVVGKSLESGDTTVRLIESNEVYTTDKSPWMPSGKMGYVNKELVNVDSANIAKVTVKTADSSYDITSPADSSKIEFATQIPAGKQLKGTDYEQVFKALSYFNFSDVMPEAEAGDINFNTDYICQLNDSTKYTFKVGKKDDKYFVKCGAEFTDLSQIQIAQDESEEELKKKEAKLVARDNAAKFNTKHKGWVYEVPGYKAENMSKTLDELIEDVPAPEPVDANKINIVSDVNAIE